MASLAASNWPEPLSLIPCMSWTTASTVYMQGVMKQAIKWPLLQKQYEDDTRYSSEIQKLIFSPELVRGNCKTFCIQIGVPGVGINLKQGCQDLNVQ